ncbi:hypothetical protein ACWEWI_13365 [Streptomyces sp. NPDC003753]
MSFALPSNIESRPVAVIGAGTLGRRIALIGPVPCTAAMRRRAFDDRGLGRDDGATSETSRETGSGV